MKWFFGLNDYASDFENYAKMLQVAVYTAQKHTSLIPHFLYDGEENSLTAWLRERNVQVIHCRSFLYEQLKQIALERADENFLKIGAGAFLRTEIPRLTAELGFDDEFILYTDLDVLFLSEVVDSLERFSPTYFAVAPENRRRDYRKMNTGVMLMNLTNLRAEDAKFKQFISQNLNILVEQGWDQGAYRLFYKGILWWKWNKLPLEFNWKPYWGDFSLARIIHFHGLKPFHQPLLSNNPPEHLKPILHLLSDEYFNLCKLWHNYYLELTN